MRDGALVVATDPVGDPMTDATGVGLTVGARDAVLGVAAPNRSNTFRNAGRCGAGAVGCKISSARACAGVKLPAVSRDWMTVICGVSVPDAEVDRA